MTVASFINAAYFIVKWGEPHKFNSCCYQSADPEPADLQWSGQKAGLDYNLLMCHGITSLSLLILCSLGTHILYNNIAS